MKQDKTKRLLTILLATMAILVLQASAAQAASKPVDFVIRVFGMPKSGSIDILINDENFLLDSWNKEHIVSEEHLDFTLGDYHPLYPFSKDINYQLKYHDKKPNPYMELKVGFPRENGHPEDFIVMAEANDRIVTSSQLSHGDGVLVVNLEYTDTSLEPTGKSPITLWIVLLTLIPGMLISIFTELAIAYLAKIHEHKKILIVNLVTTFTLSVIMTVIILIVQTPNTIIIGILWPIIVVAEYVAYKKLFGYKYSIKKMANFTVISNTISYILYLAVNNII